MSVIFNISHVYKLMLASRNFEISIHVLNVHERKSMRGHHVAALTWVSHFYIREGAWCKEHASLDLINHIYLWIHVFVRSHHSLNFLSFLISYSRQGPYRSHPHTEFAMVRQRGWRTLAPHFTLPLPRIIFKLHYKFRLSWTRKCARMQHS